MAGVIGSAPNDKVNVVNRVKLGLLLRSLREGQGKSQRDAATALGYDNSTFVCNVEKGANTIPVGKVMDFAREYHRVDIYMMACAIIWYIMPDVWNLFIQIFPAVLEHDKKGHEITQEIDDWMMKKLDRHGIVF
jgi:transcriptional regulator with XRE-family HTH domain